MTSPNQSNQVTVSDADVQTLADHVHELRPAWLPASLVTVLRGHAAAGVEYGQLRRAALTAAKNPHYSTPGGIRFELERLERTEQQPGRGAPCATCGKPYETCMVRPRTRWDEDADDHAYEPAAVRRARRAGRRPSSNETREA